MLQQQILYPVFAMVLLVFIVGSRLFTERRRILKEKSLRFSHFADTQKIREVMPDTRASDHFKNLFEMPVLFYALCLAALIEHFATPVFITLAWSYVFFRYLHAYIQCTYNRVYHRFLSFIVGSLVMAAMWIIFAIHVL